MGPATIVDGPRLWAAVVCPLAALVTCGDCGVQGVQAFAFTCGQVVPPMGLPPGGVARERHPWCRECVRGVEVPVAVARGGYS